MASFVARRQTFIFGVLELRIAHGSSSSSEEHHVSNYSSARPIDQVIIRLRHGRYVQRTGPTFSERGLLELNGIERVARSQNRRFERLEAFLPIIMAAVQW